MTSTKDRSPMHWILYALAGLVVLALILFAIGHNMSPEYSGRVERAVDAPPETVYAALLDYKASPHAGSMCKSVAALEGENGLSAWTEDLGGSVVTVRTLEQDAPNRLVREMADSIVPVKARWEFTLTPSSGGTQVVLEHRGRIDDGTWHVPFFRLTMKGLGMADKGAQQFLDSIAKQSTAAR